MKTIRRLCSAALACALAASMGTTARADYSFTTEAAQDYYEDTSYEDIYGSQYNYGGPNVVDYHVNADLKL